MNFLSWIARAFLLGGYTEEDAVRAEQSSDFSEAWAKMPARERRAAHASRNRHGQKPIQPESDS